MRRTDTGSGQHRDLGRRARVQRVRGFGVDTRPVLDQGCAEARVLETRTAPLLLTLGNVEPDDAEFGASFCFMDGARREVDAPQRDEDGRHPVPLGGRVGPALEQRAHLRNVARANRREQLFIQAAARCCSAAAATAAAAALVFGEGCHRPSLGQHALTAAFALVHRGARKVNKKAMAALHCHIARKMLVWSNFQRGAFAV